MQAVTKMADLTKFRQTDDFYANYITRDGPDHVGEFDGFGDFYANYIMIYPSRAD